MREDFFGSLARAVTRRPSLVLAVVGVLALAGAALALRLEPQTGVDTLVSGSSDRAKASEELQEGLRRRRRGDPGQGQKGKGDLQRTLLSPDLGRLIKLEGCLSGNVPAKGLKQLPAPCRELAKLKPAKVVYGPGTFINTAVNQITDQLTQRQQATSQQAEQVAEAARKASAKRGDSKARQQQLAAAARNQVQSQFTQQTLQLALRYGLTGLPSLDNPDFISTLVFDNKRGVGQPKTRFAYLFPSSTSAVVQVRLRPGLSEADRARSIELIQAVTRDKSAQAHAPARATWSPASRWSSRAWPTRCAAPSSCCWGRPCCSWRRRWRWCSAPGCGCCRWPWRWPPRR